MKSIFLVTGETGQYSDFATWNVAAYLSEEQANAHRDAAQAIADMHKAANHKYILSDLVNRHDSQFYMDYNGTKYRVEMVEVYDTFAGNNK